MRNSLIALALLVASAAVPAQADAPRFGAWGVDLTGMDKSVKPGDDFFLYANGTWLKSAVVPADRAYIGSFIDLQILTEERMKVIVNEIEAKPRDQLDAESRQLRDFYDAFVDTTAIDAKGLTPAKADLDYIAHLKTPKDVARAMGSIDRGIDSIFADNVTPNPKAPTAYAVVFTQSGLIMPERDYYVRDDAKLAEARAAFKTYIATMLRLSGVEQPEKRAAAVFDLETAVARAQWPAAERRDIDKTYNPMTLAVLEIYAPGCPWRDFLAEQGVATSGPSGERVMIVRENTAFQEMAKIFVSTPVSVWRDWMTVHYLHNMAAFLPTAIDDADFAFVGKVLSGQEQKLPRQTRAVRLLDARLGHPLGKLYVTRFFPPEAKAKADALVANLIKAYDADIRVIAWMSEVTRQKALAKLHAFTPHLGYPDKWRDYSGLAVERDDPIGNMHRSAAFEWRYRLGRIDQPVDRNEWNMTPPTVNAQYSAVLNSIFFPAAILQPPFFDPNADDAVNYGAIGAVIGHEIGHGFDDQGSKYDGDGMLQSWWTDDDRKAFEARVKALGDQFDSYEGLPGLHVNGKLTMGENIGDLSGIAIALKAYRISLGGKPAPVLDGFTGDQRFFLGYAQVWRSKYRDEQMRAQILGNPHSPPHFRVVGPTRNTDAWYDAFDVKPGETYYLPPDQRVHIW